MTDLLTALYPAGARGLTPTELLRATHRHATEAELRDELTQLARMRRIYPLSADGETRVAHPAYPPTLHHADGTFTVTVPGEAYIAALTERLDREYESATMRGYGHYGLHIAPGQPRAHPRPHPRDTTLLTHVITHLGSSNHTLASLLDSLNDPRRHDDDEPITRERALEALEILERTGLTTSSTVLGETVHHFVWLDARLSRNYPIAEQAEEGEPALAATSLHYLLSDQEVDAVFPDAPDLTEFTLETLAEATKPAHTIPTEDYVPLAALFLTGLAKQGHVRLAGRDEHGRHRYRIHPGLVQLLRFPLYEPHPIPAGYGALTSAEVLATLAPPTPLPDLTAYTDADVLTDALAYGAQDLVAIAGALAPYANSTDALRVVEQALERGGQPDPLLETPAAPLPAVAPTARRLPASGMRTHPRNPRSRGGPAHFTPEEREQIKDILRELLAEDALPPKTRLAEQLEVSTTTLNKFLTEIRAEDEGVRPLN